MRDILCGRGLMPGGGSVEEAGKDGGPGETRPLSRGSRSVFVTLGTPLRRKKGSAVIDLLANFTIIR